MIFFLVTYMHACIHTYVRTFMHTFIHTFIHSFIHLYIHTFIHTYIHTYILYMCTCVNINIYIYAHICIYTCRLGSSFYMSCSPAAPEWSLDHGAKSALLALPQDMQQVGGFPESMQWFTWKIHIPSSNGASISIYWCILMFIYWYLWFC